MTGRVGRTEANSSLQIVNKFKDSAVLAKETGWDGVQIHAAHGYLVSQFLSGKANTRTKFYGGSALLRRRFLTEILDKVRNATGPSFVVGLKLNSEDFQEGGLTTEESMNLLESLCAGGKVDFIEISGGTYEGAEMMDDPKLRAEMRPSTRRREGFFMDFARKVVERRKKKGGALVPIICTGGFRTRKGIETALEDVEMIGMARPLCVDPHFPRRFMAGETDAVIEYSVGFKGTLGKALSSGLNSFWHQRQIHRLADGLEPDMAIGYGYALTAMLLRSYLCDPQNHSGAIKMLAMMLGSALFLKMEQSLALTLGAIFLAYKATTRVKTSSN